ncbi:hypothetical protein BJ742DRAFT_780912 [Cladochytrium replicatum]|nr:hypothetical protein BJ742DRAFT_780912 [Cladochytrium replicatum]
MDALFNAIIRVRDAFQTTDSYYIALELAAGGVLFDRIAMSGRFTEKDEGVLLYSVVDALAMLHDHDTVHHDLKPDKIMFKTKAPNSQIVMMDFGVAVTVYGMSSFELISSVRQDIQVEDSKGKFGWRMRPANLSREVIRSKSIRRLRLGGIDDWSTAEVNLVVKFLSDESPRAQGGPRSIGRLSTRNCARIWRGSDAPFPKRDRKLHVAPSLNLPCFTLIMEAVAGISVKQEGQRDCSGNGTQIIAHWSVKSRSINLYRDVKSENERLSTHEVDLDPSPNEDLGGACGPATGASAVATGEKAPMETGGSGGPAASRISELQKSRAHENTRLPFSGCEAGGHSSMSACGADSSTPMGHLLIPEQARPETGEACLRCSSALPEVPLLVEWASHRSADFSETNRAISPSSFEDVREFYVDEEDLHQSRRRRIDIEAPITATASQQPSEGTLPLQA